MEKREFNSLVSSFEHAYDEMSEKVNSLGPQELDFIPPIPDAWSINEHLVHLLDADCNLFMRVRGAVAEPGRQVPVWDQESWRSRNNYQLSDGVLCLDIAITLRKVIADSLRTLNDKVREAACIVHPDRGMMSLVDVITLYTKHAGTHMDYLARNMEAFMSLQEGGA